MTGVVLAEGMRRESATRPLIECWRDFMAEAPLDWKWNINLRLAPHANNVPKELRGRPVARSSLVWTGETEAGRLYLERALSLCRADSVNATVLPFLRLQTMADSDFPHGRRY